MALEPRDLKILIVVLVVALVHGLIYVFLVPPWQHYDEPNHFEYVWLIANREKLPQVGEFDQPMRKDVAESMLEHNFFDDLGFVPDLNSTDKPVWIGTYSQLSNPPGYYLLASLPLWFIPFPDIEWQLYAVRSVSLSLYLITILVSWLISVEITPTRHPLRLIVPISLALLPGFVDLMTAVNNDAGAIVLFSIFLWGATRLVLRGLDWLTFLWTTLTVILIYWTKETAYVAFPLYLVALIFSLFRGSRRWIAWSLLGISAVVGLAAIISWGDAALWARNTLQRSPTRIFTDQAPHGSYVFQVENNQEGRSYSLHGLYQLLPVAKAEGLSGKTLTLGVWMWASEPVKVRAPTLKVYGNQDIYREVELDDIPIFIVFYMELEGNITRSWVSLVPFEKGDSREVTVYYDGLVLVEGERPLGMEPVFVDRFGQRGVWGEKSFVNLIRNSSAEIGWLYASYWADVLGGKFIPDYTRPSWIMAMVADWPGAGWFFELTAKNLVRTFWAKFGWGHVPLIGSKPYRILGVVTAIGIIGAIVFLWRKRRTINKEVVFLFGLTMIGVWGSTLIRGVNFIILRPYIVVARYAYPAIIPTMVLLCAGWWELLSRASQALRISIKWTYAIYFLLFSTIVVWSLLSIARYYYSPLEELISINNAVAVLMFTTTGITYIPN